MNARQPHQRGQALVLAILFAGVSVVLYNMGQTIHARARLTHAADAAAYSGALAQARTFNLLAYINRVQVGHQVAMAHLVTMGSWAQFGNAQAQQAGRGNPPVSLISMFFWVGCWSSLRQRLYIGRCAQAFGVSLCRA